MDGVAALTENEKEVLRLFLTSSDTKVIAQRIGRHPITVKQRLSRARRKLGVNRSLDAAHMLARAESGQPYPSGIHPNSTHGGDVSSASSTAAAEKDVRLQQALFPTKGRPWNALPLTTRLVVMVVVTLMLTLAALATVSIGESVSRMFGA
jgi:DNA-binding CsgD family transcriptional regulator